MNIYNLRNVQQCRGKGENHSTTTNILWGAVLYELAVLPNANDITALDRYIFVDFIVHRCRNNPIRLVRAASFN
jgi:hypothetical protein